MPSTTVIQQILPRSGLITSENQRRIFFYRTRRFDDAPLDNFASLQASWMNTGEPIVGGLTTNSSVSMALGWYYIDLTDAEFASAGQYIFILDIVNADHPNSVNPSSNFLTVLGSNPFEPSSAGTLPLGDGAIKETSFETGALSHRALANDAIAAFVSGVLANPSNKIVTDGTGGVKLQGSSLTALAATILLNPTNKLKTDAQGRVEVSVGTSDGQLDTVNGKVKVTGNALDESLVDGVPLPLALAYIAAATAGKSSGAGTGEEIYVGLDGVTTRLTVSIDQNKNRTNVVYH